MKRLSWSAIALIFIILAPFPASSDAVMTLPQIEGSKNIKARYRLASRGAGDVVEACFTNSGTSSVELLVRKGDFLIGGREEWMMIGYRGRVTVPARKGRVNGHATWVLRAYPLRQGRLPAVGGSLHLVARGDAKSLPPWLATKSRALWTFMDKWRWGSLQNSTDVAAYQTVIWTIVSGVRSKSGMESLVQGQGWPDAHSVVSQAWEWLPSDLKTVRTPTNPGSKPAAQKGAATTEKQTNVVTPRPRSGQQQRHTAGEKPKNSDKTKGNDKPDPGPIGVLPKKPGS